MTDEDEDFIGSGKAVELHEVWQGVFTGSRLVKAGTATSTYACLATCVALFMSSESSLHRIRAEPQARLPRYSCIMSKVPMLEGCISLKTSIVELNLSHSFEQGQCLLQGSWAGCRVHPSQGMC